MINKTKKIHAVYTQVLMISLNRIRSSIYTNTVEFTQMYNSLGLAKCCMLELDVKNVFKSSRQQKMLRTIAQHKTRLHNFFTLHMHNHHSTLARTKPLSCQK